MDDLITKQELGTVKAYTCIIKFQKRVLPNVHILLIMDRDSKPNTPRHINEMVYAEIPDTSIKPCLYEAVTSQNIHEPCGFINPSSLCMDGCIVQHRTKRFPKVISNETFLPQNTEEETQMKVPHSQNESKRTRLHSEQFTCDAIQPFINF